MLLLIGKGTTNPFKNHQQYYQMTTFTIIILFATLIAVSAIALTQEGLVKKKYLLITFFMSAVAQGLVLTYYFGAHVASLQTVNVQTEHKKALENLEYQKSQIIYRLAAELPPSPQDYKVIGLGNEGTPTADLIMVQDLSLATTEPRLYRVPSSLKAKSCSITVGSRLSWSEGNRTWSIINNNANVER